MSKIGRVPSNWPSLAALGAAPTPSGTIVVAERPHIRVAAKASDLPGHAHPERVAPPGRDTGSILSDRP